MSDYDDDMMDEDYREFLEDQAESMADPDELTPEDVFTMTLLNKAKGTKVMVELEDADGDSIELSAVIEGLIDYVKDRLKDEDDSDFTTQIVPLMSQAVVSGLGRMIGIRPTAFYLANEGTRHSIIYMMCVGLLLLKYVQEHNLLIHTIEEEVSEEEIDEIMRKSRASSVATFSTMAGMDPTEVLQEMVEKGQITESDLQDLLRRKKDDDDKGNN